MEIVHYRSEFRSAFKRLNEAWITTYFKMEKPDHAALDDPESYILDRGGFIFVALENGEPVGVCALMKRDDVVYPFELAKMAVRPESRGKNIGYALGQAVITQARELKAKHLFLESNTVLKPALGLYRKLGFKEITGPSTPYARCNIQMSLDL